LHTIGRGDLDAIDLIDEINKRLKVYLRIIVDRHTEQVLDGLGCQRRTTARQLEAFANAVGSVDLAVIRAWDPHPQVAWDGEHAGSVVDRIKRKQDHGVGQWVGGIRAAGIDAHHKQVNAGFAIPRLGHGKRVQRWRSRSLGNPRLNGNIRVSGGLIQQRRATRIEHSCRGNKIAGEAKEEISSNQAQYQKSD